MLWDSSIRFDFIWFVFLILLNTHIERWTAIEWVHINDEKWVKIVSIRILFL